MTLAEIEEMSLAELRELAWAQEKHLRTHQHLLAAILPCPAHGDGCIAGAYEWIQKAKTLLSLESDS
jgi:hypothetical protein